MRLRRALLLILAALIVASLAWQWSRPTVVPPLTPGRERIAIPAFDAQGRALTATSEIAWSHWPAVENSEQKRARQEASSLPSSSSPTSASSSPTPLPIILLHGAPGTGADFARFAAALTAKGFNVYAPDLPGFGQSDPRPPSMNMHAHAASIVAWMDHLGIEKAHIVGWSNAGGVIITLADLAPSRLASATLLGAIGCQENEGSGSYWMEHAKYAAGFATLGGVVEVLPVFGALGSFHERTNFLRQFWENDQRPLRSVMSRIQMPMLVLHGRDDFLVPCRAAQDHASRIPGCTLVLLDASHFIPLLQPQQGADVLEWWFGEVERATPVAFSKPLLGTPSLRGGSSSSPTPPIPAELATNLRAAWTKGQSAPHALPFPEPSRRLEDRLARAVVQLPGGWIAHLILIAALVAIRPTLGVLIAALLVPALSVEWFVALTAIALGMQTHALTPALLARRHKGQPTRHPILGRWLAAEPRLSAIDWQHRLSTSPFLQGWRYHFPTRTRRWSALAAGLFATPRAFAAFILARSLAAFFWSPFAFVPAWLTTTLILRRAYHGTLTLTADAATPIAFTLPLLIAACTLPIIFLAAKAPPLLLSRPGRWRLRQAFARATHREYWPTWLFYLPLVPWWFILGARFRSLHAFGACNSGIDAGGGFIGESKHRIMQNLGPSPHALATHLLPANADATQRLQQLHNLMRLDAAIAHYPLILKPDSGWRGFAVRLIKSDADALAYFESMHNDAVVQPYHPGPNEVGILWIRNRLPDSAHESGGADEGFIFSITAKRFPTITGDGVHTLEELLWRHPRHARQAHVFLERFADDASRILAKGEELRLAVSGNHCQGTLFYDGSHLITPQLTRAIDTLARNYRGSSKTSGLDAVRFDMRYTTDDALKRADPGCMGIVELNGTSSESTNIYDPDKSILWSYRVIFAHWYHMYRVGKMRQDAGVRTPTWAEFFRNARSHFQSRTGSALAD